MAALDDMIAARLQAPDADSGFKVGPRGVPMMEMSGTSASPDAVPAPAPAAPAASSPTDLDSMIASRLQGQTIPDLTPKTPTLAQRAQDSGNAVGTGFQRGLVRMLGLPVDTAANVLDLGKATIGSATSALTGNAPPFWLQVGDRSDVVGSSDWMLKQARKAPIGKLLVDPSNPDYEGGYLQNAGGALSGVMGGNGLKDFANQATNALVGATAGKAVGDLTGSPELAIAAGMSPQAGRAAVAGATRYAIRGGEAGRQDMVQRIQDLKNAGVTAPTLGLASGNAVIGGMENLLQSTPGAVGVMRRARDAAVNGMEQTATGAADLSSTSRGALEAGTAIQKGIGSFKDNFKATQGNLYDRLDSFLAPQTPIDVGNTENALNSLTATIPGAQSTSQRFINGKINGIKQGFDVDTGTVPSGSGVSFSIPGQTTQPVGSWLGGAGGGNPGSPNVIPGQQGTIPLKAPRTSPFAGAGGNFPMSAPQLPYDAVKRLRSSVGAEIADSSLVPDVPTSQWKTLYGGLSQDMQGAATAAGPSAQAAFSRANDYTRAGMDRLDRVAPFANTVAPEQAYTAMVQATRENVSTLQAVKKTLPEGARGVVAGTVIERLGRANNGVQNETGTAWSPETFLTNWNKMQPAARNELFSGYPNAAEASADVNAVARAASMMRDNSKMWANPSGTGANIAARSILTTAAAAAGGAGAGLLSPIVPVALGGLLTANNLMARGLTGQGVVNAAANKTVIAPRLTAIQANALRNAGLLNQPGDQQP